MHFRIVHQSRAHSLVVGSSVDPAHNSALAAALKQARKFDVPNTTIQRALNKVSLLNLMVLRVLSPCSRHQVKKVPPSFTPSFMKLFWRAKLRCSCKISNRADSKGSTIKL